MLDVLKEPRVLYSHALHIKTVLFPYLVLAVTVGALGIIIASMWIMLFIRATCMCSNWHPRMEKQFTLVCQVYWHNTWHAPTTTVCGFCTAIMVTV